MPSGAAGARVAKQKKRANDLAEKAAKREQEIERWFKEFDKSGDGKMDRDEMFNVLTSVTKEATGKEEACVSDELLESVMKYAANQSDGEVHPEHLLMAIKRYKGLLKENEQLSELFKKHDADASGSMDKKELLGLLREVAPPPHKYADEADAEFILSAVKSDNDTIEWEELKPAIATWMDLAKDVPKPTESKSSACVLL